MEKAVPHAAPAQNAVQQLQPCASCVGTASAGERSAGSAFDTSPRQLAQRKLIQSLQTPPVQLKTGTPISGAPSLQREAQSESPLSLEATPQPEAAAAPTAQSSGEAGEHGGENLAEQVAQAEEAEKHAQESEADEPEATAETLDSPSEESLDKEDLTHATIGTAAPSTRGNERPFQLVSRIRTRRSNRIATYVQSNARRNRDLRRARRREVNRFAPARVRTVLVAMAALGGGQGLICPRGSYVDRVNNFIYRGSRAADFAALGAAPRGHVWHHHHDFVRTALNTGTGSMILLRIADHLPGHRGGVWQFNNTPGNTLAYV